MARWIAAALAISSRCARRSAISSARRRNECVKSTSFRQRCFQVVKQAQVEIVLAERLQRIGVESDRMIERLKSAPNFHHHRGKKLRVLAAEFLQVAAIDTQSA